MKRIVLVFALLLSFSLQGQSQTETKKEKIKYLLSLMHQDSLINKTFRNISSSLATQMTTLLKDSVSGAGKDYSDKIAEIVSKNMEASKEIAKKLINEDMVDIYDKYFALEDIENFITFYQSKSGQKMIDKLPEISTDIMNTMRVKYQPTLQQSMMKEIQEMMKDEEK